MGSKVEWVDFKKIKEEVSMEDILEHYGLVGDLKRKKDELVGFCPIHDEKQYNKNSFCVNTSKNNWQCFACGAGGNVLDFVSLMEEVDIRKAGLLIQKWFEIGSQRKPAKGEKAKKKVKKTKEAKPSEEMVNPPLTFVLKNLDPDHAYLKERGLKKETIKEFGLGFCSRGLMKGRIVIPIQNEKGELVAYAGRYPGDPPEDEPKYKFPPRFQKHLVVYNLSRTKDQAKEQGLILVEGFFDVFRVWQAGFKNVVALMGTSMSDAQERLIVEAVGENGRVALMFDEDEAGRAGCQNAMAKLVSRVYIKITKPS